MRLVCDLGLRVCRAIEAREGADKAGAASSPPAQQPHHHHHHPAVVLLPKSMFDCRDVGRGARGEGCGQLVHASPSHHNHGRTVLTLCVACVDDDMVVMPPMPHNRGSQAAVGRVRATRYPLAAASGGRMSTWTPHSPHCCARRRQPGRPGAAEQRQRRRGTRCVGRAGGIGWGAAWVCLTLTAASLEAWSVLLQEVSQWRCLVCVCGGGQGAFMPALRAATCQEHSKCRCLCERHP